MSDVAVQNWVLSVASIYGYSDQAVIRANPLGPKPEGDHITYLRLMDQPSQFAEVHKTDRGVDDDVIRHYTFANQVSYSVNVYSHEGSQLLGELWRSRYLLASRSILQDAGMVLRDKSDTASIPRQSDTTWIPQYVATFRFATYEVSTEINQKILEYELFGEFDELPTTIEDEF